MSFLSVHKALETSPPGRLYEHSAGNHLFKIGGSSWDYLMKNFYCIQNENLDYFIAISWGENEDKILDIFGYSGVKGNWKGNPGIKNFIIRNGIIVLDADKEITCEDGGILIGREGEHRRKTKDLQEYLSKPLDIGWINSILAGK